MRILVTGAGGFVGRRVSAALLEAGHHVRPLRGDIRGTRAVERGIDGADGVVHLAGLSLVGACERSPVACEEINVGGSANLIAAARRQRRPPWIIFASSREVYAPGAPERVREDAPLGPLNAYGRAKLEIERLLAASGLACTVFRLASVYGPGDRPGRVLPTVARAAASGAAIKVEAHVALDFVYVDDVARAFRLALERGPGLPLMNLCTGTGTPLLEAARLAQDWARRRGRPVPEIEIVLGGAGTSFVGDPHRAVAALGWIPALDFHTGFRRLLEEGQAQGAQGTIDTRWTSSCASARR